MYAAERLVGAFFEMRSLQLASPRSDGRSRRNHILSVKLRVDTI